MSSKRYYWLKLKEDFFDDEAIEWLEEQKNGKEYALFYLKLCLKSLKSNGELIRQVGNILVPYDANKLGEITRTAPDTVMVAMELLKKIGLVEVKDSGAIYMTQLAAMVGSETDKAAQMRRLRAKKAAGITAGNNAVTLLPECGNNEATNVAAEYRDKSIEIRDKSIEREREKEKEREREPHESNGQAPPAPPTPQNDNNLSVTYGEYKNVLLTGEEYARLRELFPNDYQARIDRLSEYMASSGKKYDSHFATIRAWARDDEKQGKKPGPAAKPLDPIVRRAMERAVANPGGSFEDDVIKGWQEKRSNPPKTAGTDESIKARAEALREQFGKEAPA